MCLLKAEICSLRDEPDPFAYLALFKIEEHFYRTKQSQIYQVKQHLFHFLWGNKTNTTNSSAQNSQQLRQKFTQDY